MKKTHAFSLAMLLSIFCFEKKLHAQIPNLIISEIMYNPPEDGADSLEYIEIYNNENTSVNLEGIQFTDGITHLFSNQLLDAQTYLVLAKDSAAFSNIFGTNALQWDAGTLGNTGETLEIKNANGDIIDFVDYQNEPPWATAANGLGASLVLCDVNADNNVAANWKAATTGTGVIINNAEIIANPNANSNCPTGAIIGFLENSISVIEEGITIELQIAIEEGKSEPTEVNFVLSNTSTASLNSDFSINNSFPITLVFPAGIEKDTQIITIQILEDTEIESSETIIFELQDPTNDAIVDPMHDVLEIVIEDDDAILPDLVISEIMYNPPEDGVDSTEYIELYNNDVVSVNLENYYFSKGVEFVFPDVIVQPSEYIVITRNSSAFASYYGSTALQWTGGNLKNGGELIELRNAAQNVVDAVEYDNTADWSLAADGLGASIVLCDVGLNNNDPTNWSSSISSTGIIIDGIEIFADPGEENNCFIPLSQYQPRSIGEMTTINTQGIVDSLGRFCELKGIVHGVNLNASNGGTQFVLIDENWDGIMVYNSSLDLGYTVAEGDEVIVQGTISQFNGLTEIVPDSILLVSSNNPLSFIQEVVVLDETSESQLIQIKNVTIIDADDWDNSSVAGFTVEVTNGTDTFEMRIDQDVDLYNMAAPDFSFNLIGLGGQYDTSSPYLDGYQIYPRYFEDLEMVTANEEFEIEKIIRVYPNPANEFILLEMPEEVERIEVKNILGQTVYTNAYPNLEEKIKCTDWEKGLYLVSVFFEKEIKTIKVVKGN